MPSVKSLLIATAAAAVAAGLAGAAMAAGSHLHTLTVSLPDGGVAVIRYAGDTPPKVTLSPGAALPAAWPRAPMGAGWVQPFADLDRIAAQMDRQASAMLSQAMLNGAPIAAPGRSLASFGRLPLGAQSFSFVSNGAGANVCGRSTEVISQGAGKAPRVISRTWGHCAAHAAAPTLGVAPGLAAPAGTPVLGPPEAGPPAVAAPHLTVASLDR